MITYKTNIDKLTLGREKTQIPRVKLTNSKLCYDYLMMLWNKDTIEVHETFAVVFMNQANNTTGWYIVSQGGMTSCLVDIRMLFATALECGAVAMVIAHNHPSGNTRPSDADRNLTNQIKEVGKLHEIRIVDHIIVTADGYTSFADEGIL